MEALDQDKVDIKVLRNEKILQPTKRSRKFLSLGGQVAGIFILTGKQSGQNMKNKTWD